MLATVLPSTSTSEDVPIEKPPFEFALFPLCSSSSFELFAQAAKENGCTYRKTMNLFRSAAVTIPLPELCCSQSVGAGSTIAKLWPLNCSFSP